MPYNKLLRNIISNTNYTQEEISRKCSELGIDISRSYITKLENANNKIPTEKVSKAIAQVCNIDERLLIIEGYLDKAPKEIRNAFLVLKEYSCLYGITALENVIENKSLEGIKNVLEKEILSGFVLSITEYCKAFAKVKDIGLELKTENNNMVFNFGEIIGFKITDNAMYPLIKENDEVKIEIKDIQEYQDSDILIIKFNNKENITARQATILGKDIKLVPLNNKYHSKLVHIGDNDIDIKILGKVKKIIREI